jgi:hypothetical protein
MRLVIRGLQGGKTAYQMNEDYSGLTTTVANGKDTDGTLYVAIINRAPQNKSVALDVSAHASSATVTVREYSATYKDEETGTMALSNGVLNFTIPKSTIWLFAIPTGGSPPPTDTPEPTPTEGPTSAPTNTPEPTPTNTPGSGGVMHVGDIAMSSGSAGPNYYALATVTILDAGDAPVGTATVYGTFSGATSDSVSGDTGGDGTVTLQSSKKKHGGTWTFCVDNVVKDGWTYDPNANVETCDSITAP